MRAYLNIALAFVILSASPALAHDMAPADQVQASSSWHKASVPTWAALGEYRVWSEVGPINMPAIARAWQALRAAGVVALGLPEAGAIPPPAAIYFTTRATFVAWCAREGCPVAPPGSVLLGVYWRGNRTLWTWQNPAVVPAPGYLGGRQTLGHELTHHLLWSIEVDHIGGLHDRAGLWLNGVLP